MNLASLPETLKVPEKGGQLVPCRPHLRIGLSCVRPEHDLDVGPAGTRGNQDLANVLASLDLTPLKATILHTLIGIVRVHNPHPELSPEAGGIGRCRLKKVNLRKSKPLPQATAREQVKRRGIFGRLQPNARGSLELMQHSRRSEAHANNYRSGCRGLGERDYAGRDILFAQEGLVAIAVCTPAFARVEVDGAGVELVCGEL
jgi:hypothetical protein